MSVIRTFADDTTRDIWNGVNSRPARRIPRDLWPVVIRKLDQLDAVTRLDSLKVPPGNRLHALTGDMDYLLHVAVADLEHFSRFLLDRLLSSSGVADVNTSFVLRAVKQAQGLPLPRG